MHQQTAPGVLTPTLDEPYADGSVFITDIDSHFLVFGDEVISVTAPGETAGPPGSSSEPPDASGPTADVAETSLGTALSGKFALIGGAAAEWTLAQLVVPADSTVELDLKFGFGSASPPPVETVTASFTVPPATNLDVDANGRADALSDGVVILRYLFGFQDDALVQGVLAPDATRREADQIAAYLDNCRDTMLDADDNGDADALTDGILILRYLFGFTGIALVQDALGLHAIAPTQTKSSPSSTRSIPPCKTPRPRRLPRWLPSRSRRRARRLRRRPPTLSGSAPCGANRHGKGRMQIGLPPTGLVGRRSIGRWPTTLFKVMLRPRSQRIRARTKRTC